MTAPNSSAAEDASKEGLDYSLEGTDEDMSSLEGVVISDSEVSVVKTKSKLWRRVKPKRTDKASCEYYNEEADLEDGELPSLSVLNNRSPPKNAVSSESSSRPSTPQLDNTTSNKLKELVQKTRKDGRLLTKKGRRDGYKADSSDEYVHHPAKRLSPDSKRKHRVFWNQLDEQSDESSDDDGPDDEVAFHRTNNMKDHDIKRKAEMVENVEEEDGGGIMGVVVDLCSDCAWLTGGSTQPEKPVSQQHDRQRSINPRQRSKGRSMGDDIDDSSTEDEFEEKDDYSVQSFSREAKKSARFRRNIPSTNVDENTAIEIEYIESKENISKRSGNTLERNTSNEANLKKETREGFLQLDPRGEVSVFTRPQNLSKKFSEATSDAGPQPASEQGGYIMERSQTWSSPEKNAYLQAMALKAKEDFRRKKGLDEKELPHSNKKNAVEMHPSNKDFTKSSGDLDDSSVDDDNDFNYDSTSSEEEFDLSKYNWTPAEKRRFVQLIHSNASITRDQAIKVIQTARKNASVRKLNEKDERRINIPLKNRSEEALNMRRSRSTPSPHLATPSRSSVIAVPPLTTDTFDVKAPINEPFDSKHSSGKFNSQTRSDVSPTGVSDFPSTPKSNLNKSVDAITDNTSAERTAGASFMSHEIKRTQSTPIRVTSLLTGRRKKAGFSKVESSQINTFGKHTSKKAGNVWHQIKDDGFSDEEQDYIFQKGFDAVAKDDNDNDSVFDVEGTDEVAPITSLKLDPYHDSCDVSMLGSMISGGVTEGGSIVSGRSIYSSATNATSSTRKRHRGAAKKRNPKDIDKFQESEKNTSGWLESIKSVAAANNRKWDPKHGWIDYVEPEKATEGIEVVQIGRLRPPGFRKPEENELLESGEDGTPSNVPFPSNWQSEREEMVKIYKDDDGNASAVTEVVSNMNRTTRFKKKDQSEVKSAIALEQQSQDKSSVKSNKEEVAIKTEIDGLSKHNEIANTILNERREVDQRSKPKLTDVVDDGVRTSDYERIDDAEPTTGVFCAFPTIGKDVGTMLKRQTKSASSDLWNINENDLENNGKVKSIGTDAKKNLPSMITETNEYLKTLKEENSTNLETEQISSEEQLMSGGESFEKHRGKGDTIENEEGGNSDNYKSGSFENQSFDFSAESSEKLEEDDDDDGFKVIEGTKDMSSFVLKRNVSRSASRRERLKAIPTSPQSPNVMESQLPKTITPSPESNKDNFGIIDNDETSAFGDRSTRSVNSYMSAKAKIWMNKIDSMKDIPSIKEETLKGGLQVPEINQRKSDAPKKEEDTRRALFVSAVDENSTFEMAPKTIPKGGDSIFDIDFEDETLFDFREQDKDASKRSSSLEKALHKKNRIKSESSRPATKSNFLETTKNSRKARSSKRRSRGRPGSEASLIVDDSFSEITTPSEVSPGRQNDPTFFSRLNACAAPIIDRADETLERGEGVPQAHLDFLLQKSSPCLQSPEASQERPSLMNLLTGPNFCGNTTNLDEDEVSPSVSKMRGSVASTYLDAIKKRGPDFSGSKSIESASSTSKSETWQKFLDKRQKSLSSNRSETSDVSKTAEEYAAKKVSAIINKISSESSKPSSTVLSKNERNTKNTIRKDISHSSRSKVLESKQASTARSDVVNFSSKRPSSIGRQRSTGIGPVRRSAAAKAAEDLAAARVEAMMSTMSTSKFEEGEI